MKKTNLLQEMRAAAQNEELQYLSEINADNLKGKRIQTIYFGYKGQDGVNDFIVGDIVTDGNKLHLKTAEDKDTYIFTDKYSQGLFWCSDADRFVQYREVKMTKEELRNSTDKNYVIFWDGKILETSKSGAINSKGGLLLTAYIPELNSWIEHRSNDNHGYKGFSFGGEEKSLPSEIRARLCYKY